MALALLKAELSKAIKKTFPEVTITTVTPKGSQQAEIEFSISGRPNMHSFFSGDLDPEDLKGRNLFSEFSRFAELGFQPKRVSTATQGETYYMTIVPQTAFKATTKEKAQTLG